MLRSTLLGIVIGIVALPAEAQQQNCGNQGQGQGRGNPCIPPTEPIAPAGGTPPQQAVGEGLDELPPSTPVVVDVRQLPTLPEVRSALEQLSAPVYAATQDQIQSGAQTVRSAVDRQVDTALDAIGTGETDIEEGRPASRYSSYGTVTPEPFNGRNVWSEGFWSRTEKGTQKTDAGGAFFGFDARVFDTGVIGVIAGYDRSNMIDTSARSNSDSYTIGAYAGALLNDHWTVRLGSTYTMGDIAVDRRVAFGDFFATPRGEYDAQIAQVFGSVGYKVRLGETTIEPYVDYAYVHARMDPFNELDDSAALAVGGTSSGTSFVTPGVRVTHRFNLGEVPVKLKAMAAWRRQLNELTPSSNIAFLADEAPRLVFNVPGSPTAKDTMLVDFGFDAAVTPALSISLTYNGQFSKDAKQNGATALLRYSF